MPHIRKRDLTEIWKASDAVEQAVSAIMESATIRSPETEAQIAIIQDRNLAVRVLLPKRPAAESKSGSHPVEVVVTDSAHAKSDRKSKDSVPADAARPTGKKKRAKAAR